jgi:hypothetical protein
MNSKKNQNDFSFKKGELYFVGSPEIIGRIAKRQDIACDIPLCSCGSGKPANIKLWADGRHVCSSCEPK